MVCKVSQHPSSTVNSNQHEYTINKIYQSRMQPKFESEAIDFTQTLRLPNAATCSEHTK